VRHLAVAGLGVYASEARAQRTGGRLAATVRLKYNQPSNHSMSISRNTRSSGRRVAKRAEAEARSLAKQEAARVKQDKYVAYQSMADAKLLTDDAEDIEVYFEVKAARKVRQITARGRNVRTGEQYTHKNQTHVDVLVAMAAAMDRLPWYATPDNMYIYHDELVVSLTEPVTSEYQELITETMDKVEDLVANWVPETKKKRQVSNAEADTSDYRDEEFYSFIAYGFDRSPGETILDDMYDRMLVDHTAIFEHPAIPVIINEQDESGVTYLHDYINNTDRRLSAGMLRQILSAGANPRIRDSEERDARDVHDIRRYPKSQQKIKNTIHEMLTDAQTRYPIVAPIVKSWRNAPQAIIHHNDYDMITHLMAAFTNIQFNEARLPALAAVIQAELDDLPASIARATISDSQRISWYRDKYIAAHTGSGTPVRERSSRTNTSSGGRPPPPARERSSRTLVSSAPGGRAPGRPGRDRTRSPPRRERDHTPPPGGYRRARARTRSP
jgi:hypothetical protein